MPKPPKIALKKRSTPAKTSWFRRVCGRLTAFWRRGIWAKLLICLVVASGLSLSVMYGIARWYIAQASRTPLTLGATYIPDYARSFGLEPKQTMDAVITDLGVKRLRLVGYWSTIERTKGSYDFSELDWQMAKAEQANVRITLSLGMRQPRWPECHTPEWAKTEPQSQWEPELGRFIQAVVVRYKDSPVLDSYQLENEFLLNTFGSCTNFDRGRLERELALVKQADSHHPVIISRSNNAVGIPVNKPIPDVYAMSVYKRVWDSTITHRYVEYPFPAWYYAFFAGGGKLLTGKDLFIHELQTEPWPPNGKRIIDTSLAEQDKSMNADILRTRVDYAKATGMRTIDLWGVEWWYWRMTKQHDPSLWNTAKQIYRQSE